MEILVKKVYKSISKTSKICHEAYVFGELKSGLEIKFFDADCIIPKKSIGKKIECLVSIRPLKEGEGISMKGKYIGEYSMPVELLKMYNPPKENHLEGLHAIETEDGILFIGLDNTDFNIGDTCKFNVIRFNIFAWYPIE